ncbi:MAG: carboxypeptidase [Rubrivivax sp.]|nr:carboxypeptidase [Rubrivivax sp.]
MTAPIPVPRFNQFYRHAELTRLLQDYAAALPGLMTLSSLGKSHEGRDIWLMTVTNSVTGVHDEKPALWIDGNIHAAELTASTACLYFLHQLASGADDARIRHLLDTRTVYICPRLNPDGAELALADKPRHIRSGTRAYPYDEPHIEGLTVEDIDGDGRVLYMRLPDPHGPYKKCDADPRLMVPREPGEFGGSYYRLMPEGTLQNWDGLKVTVNKDREGLDLNRNFPAYWRQEFEQVGAGPYPASEPEVRAMVDFITRHPNIGAAVSFHTHSGVILRPMGTQSDNDMTPEDLWMYKRLSDLGAKLSGYPAISIYHDFKYHPKEIITGTQDWVYEHLGALFWTVELWAPNKEAGITDYGWIEWYRDHPVEDDLKLLKWSDDHCGGQAHVAWYPYRHPQLGMVELGGWDRMNYWRNPPPHLREREAARFPGWLSQIALSLPCLEVLRTEVRALGADTWRVRFAVANSGYLPSNVSKRAIERKTARGTVFNIHLPPGVSLISGKERVLAGHLDGHAPKATLQAFQPNREVTADRAVVEWVVHGARGTAIALTATADRAGTVRAEVTLD